MTASIIIISFLAGILVPAHAAEVTHSNLAGDEAQAIFNTFSQCEDTTVGVTVLENTRQEEQGDKERTSEVQIFASFENICEPELSTSFFGTATLEKREFTQKGLDSGSLSKTFVVDGHEIQLDLTWAGEGEIQTFETNLKEKGNPRLMANERISTRIADVSGTFVIDGQDYAAGSTNEFGSLSTIDITHITMVK